MVGNENQLYKSFVHAQYWARSEDDSQENRRKIANELQVSPAEIIFTSCGTEINNLILKSAVEDLQIERIITTELEHKCVAESINNLEKTKNIG